MRRRFSPPGRWLSRRWRPKGRRVSSPSPSFGPRRGRTFEFIEQIRRRVGSPEIVTLEPSDLNLDVFYRLHGGDAAFRIRRDIPDVRASVDHVKMRTSGSISRSVILGPAALEGPGQDASLRAVAALGDELQSLQLTIGSPATLSDLEEALDNPETRQLTLIARCEGDGLVFADEWASFANLADLASYTSAKDLLHLVTNCGVSAMNAFADTGRLDVLW